MRKRKLHYRSNARFTACLMWWTKPGRQIDVTDNPHEVSCLVCRKYPPMRGKAL